MSVASTIAPSSPYKGLAAFDESEEDALLFFGRAWETEVVAANVLASRLTVLYGPSGVGKSSLLRAGVVRTLRGEGGGYPSPAVAVYGSWSGDPLVGLEEAARAAVAEALGREPADAPGNLTDRLAAWSAELGAEVCLLLDQLEELFLYHPASEGAGGFLDLLPELVTRPGLHVNVLLGIRDDALAQLDVLKGRIPALFANSLRLDHLDRESGRVAILGPLERYNSLVGPAMCVAIEPGLEEAVLDEVAAGRIEPGGARRGAVTNGGTAHRIETPYLQLVLQRVWEVERERGSATLRVATFRGLGAAQRIVEDHLERALTALTPSQQDAAASVFGHLVTPSGTKIAHGVSDLASYAAVGESDLEPILSSLARQRILRPLGENGHAGGRYEIFHDVLGSAVLGWRARHDAEAALVRERELARRRHRRLLILTSAALLALALMTALTAYAFAQRSEANEQAALAQKQADLAATRRTQALKLQELTELSAQEADRQTDKARRAQQQAEKSAAVAKDERRRADEKAAAAAKAQAEANEQAGLAKGSAAVARDREQKATLARKQAKQAESDARASERKAKKQAAIAERQTRRANDAKRRAAAQALAQASFASLTVDPERSLKRAVDAAKLVPDGTAEEALRQALIASRLRLVLPAGARVRTASYSPDGTRVVTASDDGIARIYSVKDDRGRLVQRLRDRSSIFTASFDPTGSLVVTAGREHSAKVWSATTGARQSELPHSASVASASFSKDGRFVVTGSADKTIRLWRRNGDLVRTITVDGTVKATTFSPDGSLIAAVLESAGGRLTARVFDADSGDVRHAPDQHGIAAVAFSPDSRILATASSDRTTKLWDARSGEFLHELSQPEGRIQHVNFSPNGRQVVTASNGGTAGLWDVATGNRIHLFCCPDNFVQTASFSPDGRFVVISSLDRTARVYEILNGRQTMLLAGHEDSVLAAEFSPDGDRVVTASADGTARVWDPGTSDQLGLLGRHSGPARVASFSRDGESVLSAGDDGVARLWPARGGPERRVFRHGRAIASAALSPNGSLVATASPADGTVRLWSASTGTELARIRANRPERVVFSSDSRFLLVTEIAGGARIYRSSGSPVVGLENTDRLTAASFSHDGTLVVGGRANGFAGIWSARTGELRRTLRGHTDRVVAASFGAADTRVVTASDDGTARIWNAETGEQQFALAGHQAPLTDARFDPSGPRIVTASRDNDARTWSITTGKPIRTLRAHFGPVTAASYSSDGRWIVTAGPTTAGLWRASTGRLLALLRGPSSTVTSASFSPSGHRIAASSQDGTVRVYRCDVCGGVNELKALAELRLRRAHGR